MLIPDSTASSNGIKSPAEIPPSSSSSSSSSLSSIPVNIQTDLVLLWRSIDVLREMPGSSLILSSFCKELNILLRKVPNLHLSSFWTHENKSQQPSSIMKTDKETAATAAATATAATSGGGGRGSSDNDNKKPDNKSEGESLSLIHSEIERSLSSNLLTKLHDPSGVIEKIYRVCEDEILNSYSTQQYDFVTTWPTLEAVFTIGLKTGRLSLILRSIALALLFDEKGSCFSAEQVVDDNLSSTSTPPILTSSRGGGEGGAGNNKDDVSINAASVKQTQTKKSVKVPSSSSSSKVNKYQKFCLENLSSLISESQASAGVSIAAAMVDDDDDSSSSSLKEHWSGHIDNILDKVRSKGGLLLSFGKSDHGKLGHGDASIHRYVPTVIDSLLYEKIVKVASMSTYTLALNEEGAG